MSKQVEYFLEDHEVTTEDGYILKLQRLQKPAMEVINDSVITPVVHGQKKPAVLLVHGLACRGDNWCLQKNNLPKLLYEEGFDCWLANLRGTSPRKHVSLSTNSKKYWDFSFHEMGVYDLPAIINYILDMSGNVNLSYISHSMGFTAFYIFLAINPAYCSKISVCVALAPAAYAKHMHGIIKILIPAGNYLGLSKFIRKRPIFKRTAYQLVKYTVPNSKREKFAGWYVRISWRISRASGKEGIDKDAYRKLSSEVPNSTSIKLLCHGLQCFWSDKLKMYDYGRAENRKTYGQPIPPLYEVGNVSVPIAIFSSIGDHLCTSSDIARLSEELPNVINHHCIQNEDFSHADFIVGNNALSMYNDVLQILLEYQNK